MVEMGQGRLENAIAELSAARREASELKMPLRVALADGWHREAMAFISGPDSPKRRKASNSERFGNAFVLVWKRRPSFWRGVMGQYSSTVVLTLAGLVVAAAAGFGGDAGGRPVSSAGAVAPSERSNAGGGFSAYYSGTVLSKSCGFKCTSETLTGTGNAF